MNYELFNNMPPEAQQIRETVFVKEQGFCDEFDETDSSAIHLVGFDGSIPAATCRFFKENGEDIYIIGRFAVLKQYRGQNIGAKMLEKAEQQYTFSTLLFCRHMIFCYCCAVIVIELSAFIVSIYHILQMVSALTTYHRNT